MDDLVKFIQERIDEDGAAAKAVQPLGYTTDMGGTRLDEKFIHSRVRFASEDGRPHIEPDAAAERHFARHDPARVLREVAAKRAILEWHEPNPHVAMTWCGPDGGPPIPFGCTTCHEDDGVIAPYGYCDTLRAIAEIWSDHPDYKKEWKP